jgi:two-component system, chemotaxis family, protein-glutamate methylesterase/glutaminase
MLSFDAIVIGASAGGVDAVSTLLEALPPSFGAAVAVVIHVPPAGDDILARVLAQRCALPVRQAADKEAIEAGNVYVAPPGYHVLIEPERTFALSLDEPVHFSRPSVDVLFESAAHAFRERLLAIVLTGANADGAEGLRIVRELGGTGWVQQPATAYAQAMPTAAIARAGADRVATVAELAQALCALDTAATNP